MDDIELLDGASDELDMDRVQREIFLLYFSVLPLRISVWRPFWSIS